MLLLAHGRVRAEHTVFVWVPGICAAASESAEVPGREYCVLVSMICFWGSASSSSPLTQSVFPDPHADSVADIRGKGKAGIIEGECRWRWAVETDDCRSSICSGTEKRESSVRCNAKWEMVRISS